MYPLDETTQLILLIVTVSFYLITLFKDVLILFHVVPGAIAVLTSASLLNMIGLLLTITHSLVIPMSLLIFLFSASEYKGQGLFKLSFVSSIYKSFIYLLMLVFSFMTSL